MATMTEQENESKRVVFTFDHQSYEALRRMTEDSQFRSMAQTVREALRIMRALQTQSEQGYTEIVVRDPKHDRERTLVIPVLEQFAQH